MFDSNLRSNRGHVGGLVVALVAAAIALLLFFNKQQIIDQMSIWQYHPTAEISAIVARTTMTPEAERYFYASHPAIEDTREFNTSCGRKEPNTAILGCYNGAQIYIYNVIDKRLDGIREVTAAHEMLHAAYDRLAPSKKQHIDTLLGAEYDKLKDNKDFTDRMAFYERTEPGERSNELHSVIGTEVTSLNPELETYYQSYFKDRGAVVRLHADYASVFSTLQASAKRLSKQINDLTTVISEQSKQYNQDVAQLNTDISAFNDRATGGGFASQSQFQSERAALTERATRLDAQRTTINDSVATYSKLREELAAVSSQSEALNRSIDSNLAPAPSI